MNKHFAYAHTFAHLPICSPHTLHTDFHLFIVMVLVGVQFPIAFWFACYHYSFWWFSFCFVFYSPFLFILIPFVVGFLLKIFAYSIFPSVQTLHTYTHTHLYGRHIHSQSIKIIIIAYAFHSSVCAIASEIYVRSAHKLCYRTGFLKPFTVPV